jgi:tape measure domain-containing protein
MAGEDLGTLYASLALRHDELIRDVSKVKAEFKALADKAEGESKRINDALVLKQSVAQIGSGLSKYVTLPLLAAGAAGLKFASSIETQQLAFGTLLGNMEKGKSLYQELVTLSAKTPLQLPDVTSSAQSLIAYGVNVKDLKSTIMMLGDVSMGNAEKLQRATLAYGQTLAAGKANMQDLNQLINNGVPIVEALSNVMGVGKEQIRKLVEQGKVGFAQVDAALKTLVADGGKFNGMMQTIGEQSAEGKLSTAIDNLRIAAANMMQDLVPVLKEVAENVSVISGKFSELEPGTRKAILAMLGMTAVIGPLAKVTTSITSMGKALAVITSTPLGVGITAGVVALTGLMAVVQKIKNADRDLLAADEKLTQETKKRAVEAERLTKTYTELSSKTKLTKEEQAQLAETAKTLKELFPELTAVYDENTGAISLNSDELKRNAEAQAKAAAAAIQKQIADTAKLMYAKKEAVDNADARSKESEQKRLQAIDDYIAAAKKAGLAGIDKDSAVASIEEQGKSYKNLSAGVIRIIETYKAANAEIYTNSKNAQKLRAEYDELVKAFNKLYDARYKVETADTPDSPTTPTAAATADDKSQGARLKALDLYYRARVDAAAKGSAEENALLKEYNDKRQDLLWSFVEEDIKNGKTAAQSLDSAFKDVGMSYKTLGSEIAIGLDGTKYAYSDFTASITSDLQTMANTKGVTIEELIGDPARTEQVTSAMVRALVAVKERIDALMAAGGDQGALQKAIEPLQALYASLAKNLKSPFTLMLEDYNKLKRELESTKTLLGQLNDKMTEAIFAGDTASETKYVALIEQMREKITQLESELGIYDTSIKAERERARESGSIAENVTATQAYIKELEREQDLLTQGTVGWEKKQKEIKKVKDELTSDVVGSLNSATKWVGITENIANAIKDGIENGFDLGTIADLADDLGTVIGAAVGGPAGAAIGQAIGSLVGSVASLLSTLFENNKDLHLDADKFMDSIVDHRALAKAAVDKIVEAFNDSLPDELEDASAALVDAITSGFVDGNWENLGDAIDEQLRTIVVNKIMAAGLFADQLQSLIEEGFSGSTKSGKQLIHEKEALRDALQKELDDLKDERDMYKKIMDEINRATDEFNKTSDSSEREQIKDYIDRLRAKLKDLEDEMFEYQELMKKIEELNQEIAAIDPNAEGIITFDDLTAEKIQELINTYGDAIKDVLESMGLWSSEVMGAAKVLGDEAVSALVDSLMESAWSADYSSFEQALGEKIKAAVISAAIDSMGVESAVQKIVDKALAFSEGGYTDSELAALRAMGQSLYDSTQAVLDGISQAVDAAFGLQNSTVRVESKGSVVTMMTGSDRDYLAESIRQGLAALSPIFTLTAASIAQLQCTEMIVQSLSYYHYGDFVVGNVNATDFESFVRGIVGKMIDEA